MDTKRILIVDDDPNIRKTLSGILKAKGYAPTAAGTGKAALDNVTEGPPAVVLIDLRLGDLPGLEVMREIKTRSPRTECIVLTGYASQSSAIKAVNLGAYSYVQKPYDVEQLLVTIRRAIEKRETEEALVQSERYFRSLLQNIHEDILVITRDHQIVDSNRTFLITTGHKREDVIGRRCFGILHGYNSPCDQHGKHCLLQEVFETGEPCNCRHERTRMDGSRAHVDILLSPLKDEGGNVTQVIEAIRDITDLMKAQEAVRASEKRYRALSDGVPIGLYQTAPDGQILTANRATVQMLGYPDQESLLAADVLDLYVHRERRVQFQALVERRGGVRGFEVQLRRHDGTTIWMEVDAHTVRDDAGQVLYYEGAIEDITERKRAEEEREHLLAQIREQAQQMQEVVDTVPEGVILLDAAAKIVLTNPLAQKDLKILTDAGKGDTLTHLGGLPLSELLSFPEDREWHEIKADGRTFEVIARPVPIMPESTGWVLVIRDMTHEREMQRRMRQQDRLVAIGRLAGGIAHDFNNILTAIEGYTGFVFDELAPGDPMRADLEEVRKAADRAAGLTKQLLIFSRKQVSRPRVLNLNTVIVDMEKMLRRVIGEDIDLDTVLDPSLGQVKADPGQIEQVIMNLCVNARDAMPHGGQLTVETDNIVLDEAYAWEHPQVQPGAYVLLSVSDTGIGMDEEVKSHLFEPFFTTKETGKGTGLGLATVYGIIHQSGGHIHASSELGVGTTFRIYLPRVEEEAESIARKGELARLPRGTETILLLEDEDVVRQLAVRALRMRGYTVLEARRPSEAIFINERQTTAIALLVTDVVLPEMGGRDLAERLASSRPEMRVLYISGYMDDTIADHGALEPGVTLLEKPFTPADLLGKVREVLDAPIGT